MKIEKVYITGVANGAYLGHVTAHVVDQSGHKFCVKGMRILMLERGLTLAMPSEPREREGKIEHKEFFHPMNRKTRSLIEDAVFAAYELTTKREDGEETE